MNNIDLVSKYLKIFNEHYFRGAKSIKEIQYLAIILNEYKDKLDSLDEALIIKILDTESSISSYKERMGIDELIILLDKNRLEFNNRYCYCMNTIMNSILRYHEEINNKELMEITNLYGQVRYGFERYICESSEFRDFIKELGKTCGYNFKTYIFEFLSHIGAYIYYNSLDPELLREVSIVFMCHFGEVVDILRINGFSFYDDIDNEYLKHFVSLVLSLGYHNRTIKKGLS